MKITKNELPNFGKAYTLLKASFIVINQNLCIEYLNDFAKKTLKIKNGYDVIGKSFFHTWNHSKRPPLLDEGGKIIQNAPIKINHHFREWESISVDVDSEQWLFLIDKDVTDKERIYITLENACADIIGHQFNERLSVLQYINEVHNYLNSIINKIPCYVYWKNKKLQYIGCNQMAADFINLKSTDEIIGKTDFDIFIDHNLAKSYRATDRQIFANGKAVINQPGELVNNEGKVLNTLVSKVPITDQMGEVIGLAGISVDVTDLKNAQALAESANHAKTEFIANMSHDIRTPLTGVVGMSQILEDELQNSEQKQYAQMVHQCGDQLLGLLNGILDVISADTLQEQDVHEETFDLRQCIQDILQLERPSTELKGIGLTTQIAETVPSYIVTDRTKLHRIILNLIGNAIKFTNMGGVFIEIKSNVIDDEKVQLQFRIRDTGIGISIALQDKVFDRFFRVDPSYKGVYKGHGIGLHIAQSYAALLGGELKLTSKEGNGTTFYFDLTCRIGKIENVVSLRPALPSLVIKPENDNQRANLTKTVIATDLTTILDNKPILLLVEDNCVALKILESMVKQANVQYISAIDGESALDLAKAQSFDLIISDIGLPGITGNEFTHQFRTWEVSQHQSPIPIIGLTAHAQGEIRDECLRSGMNDVYTKPMLLPVLKEIIVKYVQSAVGTETSHLENSSSGLGRDLPDIEEKLFELDAFPLLDIEHALEGLDNNKDLLTDILQSMINQEIPTEKTAIQAAYATKDWSTIEKLAHKMKGGAVYAGVVKMQYACQYLERYRKAGHTKLLEQLYQQMITVFDETHKAITQWIQIQNH